MMTDIECHCPVKFENLFSWTIHRIVHHGEEVNDNNPNLIYGVSGLNYNDKTHCPKGHELTSDNLLPGVSYRRLIGIYIELLSLPS